MGIRRRTRRLRRWYRRHKYSTGMVVARVGVISVAIAGAAILVAVAVQSL